MSPGVVKTLALSAILDVVFPQLLRNCTVTWIIFEILIIIRMQHI
jgi:hypothetical protein